MSATEKALREVLAVLDGWVEGDSDCCTTFHPDDIRRMVEDARQSIKAKRRKKKASTRQGLHTIVVSTPGLPRTHHVITPGDTLSINLSGYVATGTEIKALTMPVDITITGC